MTDTYYFACEHYIDGQLICEEDTTYVCRLCYHAVCRDHREEHDKQKHAGCSWCKGTGEHRWNNEYIGPCLICEGRRQLAVQREILKTLTTEATLLQAKLDRVSNKEESQ